MMNSTKIVLAGEYVGREEGSHWMEIMVSERGSMDCRTYHLRKWRYGSVYRVADKLFPLDFDITGGEKGLRIWF